MPVKRFWKLRPPSRVKKSDLVAALKHINSRIVGELSLQKSLRVFSKKLDSKNPQEAELIMSRGIDMSDALFRAGRITTAEFVFHCGHYIISHHEKRHLDGFYDPLLKPYIDRMKEIETQHGLAPKEYWLINDAPKEYQEQSKQYSHVLEREEINLFKKHAPASLSKLRIEETDKFRTLYESGRRSVFHREDTVKPQL